MVAGWLEANRLEIEYQLTLRGDFRTRNKDRKGKCKEHGDGARNKRLIHFQLKQGLQLEWSGVIDLHGIVGSTRHFGMGVPFFAGLARRENLAVLDAGWIVPVGSRVVGNGVPRLLGPFGEQITGLLEYLGMLGVLGQIG